MQTKTVQKTFIIKEKKYDYILLAKFLCFYKNKNTVKTII